MIALEEPDHGARWIARGANVSMADEKGRTQTGGLVRKKGATSELLGDILFEDYEALKAATQKDNNALSRKSGNG